MEYLAVVCVKLMKFQAESPTVPRMGLHKLSRAPQPSGRCAKTAEKHAKVRA